MTWDSNISMMQIEDLDTGETFIYHDMVGMTVEHLPTTPHDFVDYVNLSNGELLTLRGDVEVFPLGLPLNLTIPQVCKNG